MLHKLISVIGIIMVFLSIPVMGQKGTFFSSDSDLSSSLINQIYQDKKGIVWISTEDGLNRFDGVKFTIYKHNPLDSTSIKNNYVQTILEDNSNRFWVGCSNSLQLYIRSTDAFTEIPLKRDGQRVHAHIKSIIECRNGDILVATSGQGIFILERGEVDFRADILLNNLVGSLFLNVIYEDTKGYLWIASEERGIIRYNPKNEELLIFNSPTHLKSDFVTTISEDATNLYIGTLNGGLYQFDSRKTQFQSVSFQEKNNLNIRSLCIDNNNRLIVGCDGNGIKVLDKQHNILVDYQPETVPFNFEKNKIHSLMLDREHNLWIGIFQKGVAIIPKTQNKFDYIGSKSYKNNVIGSSCVMSIFRDHKGITWVGTDNDGLYAINDQGEQLAHYAPDGKSDGVPATIMCIYEDSNKELWLGSYFNGLVKFDRNSGRCKTFDQFPIEVNKNHHPRVFCIHEDTQKRLWIGTYGSGIYRYDLNSKSITHFESSKNENADWSQNELPNDWVNCIIEDKQGLLWFGTYNGLSCFDPNAESFNNYYKKNNLLPGHIIYALYPDNDNNIWIGTSQGLIQFNQTTQQYTKFTTTEGLPSDVICGITEDERGNLWLSTLSGISKYHHKTGHFSNFSATDGLQGNEFSRGAVFKDKRGKIFFGGINGVTSFYAKNIAEQRPKPQLTLVDFYLFNKRIKQGDLSGKNNIVDTWVSEAETFTLSHRDNSFSLEFSSMNFNNQERIIYEYRIVNHSKTWMQTPAGTNRINFSSMAPGNYEILVRAFDNNVASFERLVKVHILPPPYLSSLAKTIYCIILLLLIIGAVYYSAWFIRKRKKEYEMEQSRQTNEGKLQFFINLAHEIRTPMTLVIGPLEKLINESDDPHTSKVYKIMYRNSQRILRLINQLMDIRKLDKGLMKLTFQACDILEFTKEITKNFDHQVQSKQINLLVESTEESLTTYIDCDNFDKVLMNLLSNAFKFTPERGEIIISLTKGVDATCNTALRDYIEIVIADNGIGIDPEKIGNIFERFYQINNDSKNSSLGTGVGLHLTQLLVNLHHGTIRAENRRDTRGTKFIIRIPAGKEHIAINEIRSQVTSQGEEAQHAVTKPVILPNQINRNEVEIIHNPARTQKRARILLVDDEEDIRFFLRDELKEYLILEASNGKDALEIILKEEPDLVISDVMMPYMDGNTLCKKIRQNININHIPVILLTAKSNMQDRLLGLEIGADAYLTKPFNIDEMTTIVANLLMNRRRLRTKFKTQEQQELLLDKIELKSSDELFLERVMKVINENLSDPDLNVEKLAQNVGISRVHMHRKLKALTNQSARDFIRNLRLKQAAQLLAEKKHSISEVAYASGFSNLSHFSNTFKEQYGYSPKEWAANKKTEM